MDSNYIEVLKKSLANFEKINRSQELKIQYQKDTIEELESKLQEQENDTGLCSVSLWLF